MLLVPSTRPIVRALLLALALGTLAPLPSGCALLAAYDQRRAIEQARFALRGVGLESIDLASATFRITLELDNPTTTALELDRLDYTLYVNDTRVVTGATTTHVLVPAGQTRTLPVLATIRFRDVPGPVRGVLLGGKPRYRVAVVGHFDTPFGTIDYPVTLER